MPTRDFDAARAERLRQRDPIRFVLGGETFTCLPVIPVGAGLDLADAGHHPMGTVGYTQALHRFIRSALVDDDLDRFEKVLTSKTDPVGPNDLQELAEWLAEEYTARPTSPSTDSSGGRQSSGDPSSNGSREMVSEASST